MWHPLLSMAYNVSAVATPMSWTLEALLLGGARTQRIGVVPARAPAVNGIRPDGFPPAPLADCFVMRSFARPPAARRSQGRNSFAFYIRSIQYI